jgi:hypothetical protein
MGKGSRLARSFFLGVLLLLHLMPDARSTSRIYSTIEQLINRSDVIALVTVGATGDENPRRPFHDARAAKVQQILKGELSEPLVIQHGSGRDDTLFQQGPGEYLVFLKRRDSLLVPTDGWPSSKFVSEGMVQGWCDSQRHDGPSAPLSRVVAEIESGTPR